MQAKFFNFLKTLIGDKAKLGASAFRNPNSLRAGNSRVRGTLAGVINSYNPSSKTYVISAVRSLNINNEKETINLRGVIKAEDLDSEQTILAHRIANLSLGFNSDYEDFSVKESDFDNLDLSPSSLTNQNNNLLKEAKRKELFLKYFNWTVKGLFKQE